MTGKSVINIYICVCRDTTETVGAVVGFAVRTQGQFEW